MARGACSESSDDDRVRDEMDEPHDTAEVLATFETHIDRSGTPTIKLTGELDIGSVDPIRTAFDAIAADRPARVVIDLSELRFIDSSGLSLFLALAEHVAEVELRDPSETIRKVISLTGLTSLFLITP
jgi:anti-sigma B factor antagonist